MFLQHLSTQLKSRVKTDFPLISILNTLFNSVHLFQSAIRRISRKHGEERTGLLRGHMILVLHLDLCPVKKGSFLTAPLA